MRGDGRIFTRGGVLWCAYYLRGVEHRQSTKTADPDKAAKFLKRKLKEVAADEMGGPAFVTPTNQRLTLRDLLEALRGDYKIRGKLSPQSANHIDRVVSDLGDYRAIAFTAERADAYVTRRVEQGHAPSSINRTVQLVGQAFKLAIRRGHLAKAPALPHLSEAGNERQGFFDAADFNALVEHLPAWLQDFTRFGFMTGMRKNEIASLRWADVDGDVLKLRGVDSKNGRARLIPLVGELKGLLDRRFKARQIEKGETIELSPLVFHREGQPIRGIRKSWARACCAVGLGKMVCPKCKGEGTAAKCPNCKTRTGYTGRIFHDLRRSAIRAMVKAGVTPQVAKQVSGHRTDSCFHRYSILTTDDVRDALKRTEEYRKTTAVQKVVSMGSK